MSELSAIQLMKFAAQREGLATVSVLSPRVMAECRFGDGIVVYAPPRPWVRVSDRFGDQMKGIVLAHELGHVLDWRKEPRSYAAKAAAVNFRFESVLRMPSDHLTSQVMLPVAWGNWLLQIEESAWDNAKRIASTYTAWVGVSVDWSLWSKAREWALGSYYSDVQYATKGGNRRAPLPDASAWDPNTKPRGEQR